MPRRKERKRGEGSIYQRKSDGKWVGKYKAGLNENRKPVYKTLYGKSRTEVEKKLDDALGTVKKLNPIINTTPLSEYLLFWLTTAERQHLAPKSYDRKEQTIRLHVNPYIGHIPVGALTTDNVNSMITDLQNAGLSYSTIKKAYEVLTAAYRWGMECQPPKVSSNPARAATMVTKKVLPPKEIHYYDLDTALALCRSGYATWGNGSRIYRLGAVVELLLNTGLRMAEVLALKWNDIKYDERKIYVSKSTVHVRDLSVNATTRYQYVEQQSTKTKSGYRKVPLTPGAIHALDDLKKITGNGRYVLATEDGTPVRERYLDRLIAAIGKRAGLPDDNLPSAHALRHTYASLFLYGKGGHHGDVKILSVLLGHKDVNTTYNIYAHVLEGAEFEGLDVLPSVAGETVEDEERKEAYLINKAQREIDDIFPDVSALEQANLQAQAAGAMVLGVAHMMHQDDDEDESYSSKESDYATASLLMAFANQRLQDHYVNGSKRAREVLGYAYKQEDFIATVNAIFVEQSWPTRPYTENLMFETYLPALNGQPPICKPGKTLEQKEKEVRGLVAWLNGDYEPEENQEEKDAYMQRAEEAIEYYEEHPYSDYDENWEDYQEQ